MKEPGDRGAGELEGVYEGVPCGLIEGASLSKEDGARSLYPPPLLSKEVDELCVLSQFLCQVSFIEGIPTEAHFNDVEGGMLLNNL